jgi:hypothetical protein
MPLDLVQIRFPHLLQVTITLLLLFLYYGLVYQAAAADRILFPMQKYEILAARSNGDVAVPLDPRQVFADCLSISCDWPVMAELDAGAGALQNATAYDRTIGVPVTWTLYPEVGLSTLCSAQTISDAIMSARKELGNISGYWFNLPEQVSVCVPHLNDTPNVSINMDSKGIAAWQICFDNDCTIYMLRSRCCGELPANAAITIGALMPSELEEIHKYTDRIFSMVIGVIAESER